jgi:hypothetical protein
MYRPHLNICPECAHRNGQQYECNLHQPQAVEIESCPSEFVEYQFDWCRLGLLKHAGPAVRMQRTASPQTIRFTTANSSTAKRIPRKRTRGTLCGHNGTGQHSLPRGWYCIAPGSHSLRSYRSCNSYRHDFQRHPGFQNQWRTGRLPVCFRRWNDLGLERGAWDADNGCRLKEHRNL